MSRRAQPPQRNKQRGATAIEFAMVFPIFVVVIFFFFESWRFVQFRDAVDQAALEAGRAAIVPGATAEEARARANTILASVGANSAVVTITPQQLREDTDEVTIDVTLPYADVGLFFQYFASDYDFHTTLTLDTENKRVGRM